MPPLCRWHAGPKPLRKTRHLITNSHAGMGIRSSNIDRFVYRKPSFCFTEISKHRIGVYIYMFFTNVSNKTENQPLCVLKKRDCNVWALFWYHNSWKTLAIVAQGSSCSCPPWMRLPSSERLAHPAVEGWVCGLLVVNAGPLSPFSPMLVPIRSPSWLLSILVPSTLHSDGFPLSCQQ